MQSITLIIAMQSEAQPVIDALALAPKAHPFHASIPFKLYSGQFEGAEVNLLISGTDPNLGVDNVATVPAALMTYLAIEHLSPDIIVNAGTAGGIEEKGCAIGDVYLSAGHFSFHDRRIPIPGYKEYGEGRYPAYDTSDIAHKLGLKTGAISSGDSLDLLDEDFQAIKKSGATIKEMEAAAVAWVCQTMGITLIAVKAITDLIDQPYATEEQFLKNLTMAVEKLGEKVPAVVRELVDMDIHPHNLK